MGPIEATVNGIRWCVNGIAHAYQRYTDGNVKNVWKKRFDLGQSNPHKREYENHDKEHAKPTFKETDSERRNYMMKNKKKLTLKNQLSLGPYSPEGEVRDRAVSAQSVCKWTKYANAIQMTQLDPNKN